MSHPQDEDEKLKKKKSSLTLEREEGIINRRMYAHFEI